MDFRYVNRFTLLVFLLHNSVVLFGQNVQSKIEANITFKEPGSELFISNLQTVFSNESISLFTEVMNRGVVNARIIIQSESTIAFYKQYEIFFRKSSLLIKDTILKQQDSIYYDRILALEPADTVNNILNEQFTLNKVLGSVSIRDEHGFYLSYSLDKRKYSFSMYLKSNSMGITIQKEKHNKTTIYANHQYSCFYENTEIYPYRATHINANILYVVLKKSKITSGYYYHDHCHYHFDKNRELTIHKAHEPCGYETNVELKMREIPLEYE